MALRMVGTAAAVDQANLFRLANRCFTEEGCHRYRRVAYVRNRCERRTYATRW